MIELIVAVLLVALLRDEAGVRPGDTLAVGALVWLGTYMASCAVLPYRRNGCPNPWCSKRKPTQGDKRGNFRRRKPCRVCGNGDWRRLGARVMRRGR